MGTELDHERCYRAVASRDSRFDGVFFTAVRSTGVYCRPSCPARTPLPHNVDFFRTPAAAQVAGYRACRRCRPDAVPGSAEWNVREDVVGRAMRLVGDGAVDRVGVSGVAAALGYSARHLNRLVTDELGAGLLVIARSQRAHTARLLLQTTDLPITDVAWAAGFSSIRSFNETVATIYGEPPTAVRRRAHRARTRTPGADHRPAGATTPVPVDVRLAARPPFDATRILEFLGERAVLGLEAWDGRTYRRTLDLPHSHGTVSVRAIEGGVRARFQLADLRDLTAAVARVRRLFDLDADPLAVADLLGRDPLLAPLVAARPGLRVPGAVAAEELLVRAIVGQQVSVAGARTVVGRLVGDFGAPLQVADPQLDRVFPSPDRLAGADPAAFAMPRTRSAALIAACAALADGSLTLDAGTDRTEVLTALQRVKGIGPWTAGYVAMRGLGDPDVLLDADLGVGHAMTALGQHDRPAALAARGHAWRPWRSYANAHLWASLPPAAARTATPERAVRPTPLAGQAPPTRGTRPALTDERRTS